MTTRCNRTRLHIEPAAGTGAAGSGSQAEDVGENIASQQNRCSAHGGIMALHRQAPQGGVCHRSSYRAPGSRQRSGRSDALKQSQNIRRAASSPAALPIVNPSTKGGFDLRSHGSNHGHQHLRFRCKTMRHWITSFRLLNSIMSVSHKPEECKRHKRTALSASGSLGPQPRPAQFAHRLPLQPRNHTGPKRKRNERVNQPK